MTKEQFFKMRINQLVSGTESMVKALVLALPIGILAAFVAWAVISHKEKQTENMAICNGFQIAQRMEGQRGLTCLEKVCGRTGG